MDTVYNLLKRASVLRGKTETDSISPDDVGGILYDTLQYVVSMEQDMDGLGIRKVYKTKAEMEEDTNPLGTNGKALRYGQLVCIYDEGSIENADNGNLYAWQKPGWIRIGNISDIYSLLDAIAREAQERKETAERIYKAIFAEIKERQKYDDNLDDRLESHISDYENVKKKLDEQLIRDIDVTKDDDGTITVEYQRHDGSGGEFVIRPRLDMSLYRIVPELPTAGIEPDKIYLVKDKSGGGNNKYKEYLYLGDPMAAYDPDNWEVQGEYVSNVDLTEYVKFSDIATAEKAGLMNALDKKRLDNLFAEISREGFVNSFGRVSGGDGENVEISYEKIQSHETDSIDTEHYTLVIPSATESDAGAMSADDKAKLNDLEEMTEVELDALLDEAFG